MGMGDNVNLASRLEQLGKKYGVNILLDGKTCDEEGVRDSFLFRLVDIVTVKGRSQPTELYELVACKEQLAVAASEDSTRRFCDDFGAIHELYRTRRFQEALVAIEAYQQRWPADTPSQILKDRCTELL